MGGIGFWQKLLLNGTPYAAILLLCCLKDDKEVVYAML